MVPDLNFVNETFHLFNSLIFSNDLPLPRFRLTHARSFRGKLTYRFTSVWGKRRCSDYEMRISLDFDLPRPEWEDVVIHEMIHLHIAYKGIKDSSSHGPKFRALMTEINHTHGRHITVTARHTKEELDRDKRVRGHYLCLVRFHDGRLGIAPVAKSRILELWQSFKAWPEIRNVSWIGSVDPWFNRFPRVLKTKVYISSDDELLPHLKGALRLTLEGSLLRATPSSAPPSHLLP